MRRGPLLAGVVGLGALFVIGFYVTTGHKGTGAKGPEVGSQMPPFAAPLALSALNGDVNLSPSACSVQILGAFTSCAPLKKGPLVLAFVTVSDKQCSAIAGSLSVLRQRLPGSTVVLVGLRGGRRELARLALRVPDVTSIWDRDGALATRYGIAVCPTVVVGARGGQVRGTLIGSSVDRPGWLVKNVNALLDRPTR
ncbi:MAG: hypothetical protein NTX07_08075 [Solirubrobacterales bacterium]|nr:hypothetical protein [Solirubrobacterales bacterium]